MSDFLKKILSDIDDHVLSLPLECCGRTYKLHPPLHPGPPRLSCDTCHTEYALGWGGEAFNMPLVWKPLPPTMVKQS
jgi:hypothetical protein